MTRYDRTTRGLTKGQRARRRRLGTRSWKEQRAEPNGARVGKRRTGRNR